MIPAISVTLAHIDEVNSFTSEIVHGLVLILLIVVVFLVQSRKVWAAVIFTVVFTIISIQS
jgi:hypothetical protein